MTAQRGFLYVATGQSYIDEAAFSAQSYKQHMGDIPIVIYTDDVESARQHNVFDQCLELKDPEYGPSDKFYGLRNTPFEESVFIDTDTWCLDQCSELFRMLDRFEFAAAHAPVRAMNFVPKGVPRCFPELNTGVLAYKKTNEVLKLFEQWELIYQDFRARRNIIRDQLSFRKALYESNVNLSILPPEYNLRATFSYMVGGMAPVKIIHARGGDLERALKVTSACNEELSLYPYVVNIARPAPSAKK
jgi:hypothetical protein